MPVVFVHGVNNRKEDPGYEAGVLVQKKFLEHHLTGVHINGKTLTHVSPVFPYWGDLATQFAWNMASLPKGEIDALGAPGVSNELRPLIADIYDDSPGLKSMEAAPLLTLARRGLPKAVRALSDAVLLEAKNTNDANNVNNANPANRANKDNNDNGEIASFVVAAQLYAEAHPAPPWLSGMSTDMQLIDRLVAEIRKDKKAQSVEGLGFTSMIMNPVSSAVLKIQTAVKNVAGSGLDRIGDFASTRILGWSRRSFNANIGRFFGDVFVYLDTRGDRTAPGPIPRQLLTAIDDAIRTGATNEPLIIIGHSLGGVIMFDLLSHFRPDLEVDAFVSVGSQVSHFEEIKRFKESNPAIPSPGNLLAKTPTNILRWINVFDEVDVFSYACKAVFDRVDDFKYDTQTHTLKAHGAYLTQNRFYQRLRERLGENQ